MDRAGINLTTIPRNESPNNSSRDIIVDFDGSGNNVGDMIDLSGVDANAGMAGNQAFTLGQLSYSGGVLTANISGPGGDLQIQLNGSPPLDLSGPSIDVVL